MTSTSNMGSVEVPFGHKKRQKRRRSKKREYTLAEAADELLADPDAEKKTGRRG